MTTTAGEPVRPATATGPGRATADTPYPEVALLSNGRYGVLITAAGAGFGTWRGLDVTRWREDATRDCWGQFCYVRDLATARPGRSATSRSAGPPTNTRSRSTPTGPSSAAGTATSRPAWPSASRRTTTRKSALVTLVNHGDRPRELDLTSYAEVCLNHRRADQAHPAFAKLFLETEFVPGPDALLARRRPRAADQKPVWAVHVSAADGPVRVRDRPRPVPGPRPDAGQSRGAGPRRPACPAPPARCWTRSSACGGASASSRGRRRASRSSPGRPTPGRRPSPSPSSSATSRPLTGHSPTPGPAVGTSCGSWA